MKTPQVQLFLSFSASGQGDHGETLCRARAAPDLRGVGGNVPAEPEGGRADGPGGDRVPTAGRVRVQ